MRLGDCRRIARLIQRLDQRGGGGVACHIDQPSGTQDPLFSNASPSTTFSSLPLQYVADHAWGETGIGKTPTNVFLNGAMERWVLGGPGGTEPYIWGARPYDATDGPVGYHTPTKCGVGQTDTTRTNNARYCALIVPHDDWGYNTFFPMFPAATLAGMEGALIWASFKIKVNSGPIYMEGMHSTASPQAQRDVSTIGRVVENGFRHIVYAWKVTADMVTHGFDLRFNFIWGRSFYLSELMCGLGEAAPAGFMVPSTSLTTPGVRMEGANLIVQGTAAPTTGGDPILGAKWNPGDRVENTAPAAGGYVGWVCTAAGTPGTWKGYGEIAP